MYRSFVYMWQKEGLYGFFKGNGVNVVRIAPFTAFEFFFYDFYKENLFGGQTASKTQKLICGGLTGCTASFLTYPLDLIRTLLSIDVGKKGESKIVESQSILGTGRQVIRTHGILGLYKGLFSTLFVSLIDELTNCRVLHLTLRSRWPRLISSRHSTKSTRRILMHGSTIY